MSLVVFIVILFLLILVHELGHFVAAKLFKIRVDEFNIGFGPSLATFTRWQTRFGIKPILVGGYVNIDEASMATKPRPLQAAVIIAGILFNILFAWLVL